MAVVTEAPSPVEQSSGSAESIVPGVRARTATTVIQKASDKVVSCINLESMEQSFPDFLDSEADRQFVKLLMDKTGQHLQTGFEQAWKDLMVNSEYKNFISKANQVDQIFAAATQRRARREEPQDAWKRAADPTVAIAATVIPKLQGHLEALRGTSSELSDRSRTQEKAILDKQAEADAMEREIATMLTSIHDGQKNLSSIDKDALRQLSDSLIPLVSPDKL